MNSLSRWSPSLVRHWAVLVALGFGSAASAQTADLVEYFNPATKAYFRTANSIDIASADASGSGWSRTGANFKVWATQSAAPVDAVPLYRFFEPASNTYFYAARTNEVTYFNALETRGRAEALAAGTAYAGWTQQRIEGYVALPTSAGCGAGTQPIYRSIDAKQSFKSLSRRLASSLPVYQDMADASWWSEGVTFCAPGTSTAQLSDIHRLLRQASFGANDALVAKVQAMGINAWVEEQLNPPVKSSYPVLPFVATNQPTDCTDTVSPTNPTYRCARDNYSLFPVQQTFMQNALKGDDQLRQRVAFALSQILVTSGLEVRFAYAMGRYQQIFLDNAFGNYRDILKEVTLSPVMGDYLNMANSNKPDPARGISANENYAREIMQLFSVGLYKLNIDGTYQRDSAGALIPTYTQTTVENLARVFTGWTYANFGGAPATRNNAAYYEFPMVAVESNHDTTTKTLMDGFVVPAGQTSAKDLDTALDHIFNHPNVGPFISRQLIQRLVGGDPTPAYVARVASVFNNNGAGVRGDLRAVVRAILLDPEARGEIKTSFGAGNLTEPILFMLRAMRGLGGTADGVDFINQSAGLSQRLFYAPTVFNYFSPEVMTATGKNGPEFGIYNSAMAFARANFVWRLLFTNTIAADATVAGATGTSINWTPWAAMAGNPAALVDKLSWTFANGALSDAAQKRIVTAVNTVASTDTTGRARMAAYLVLTSAQANVNR